MKKSFYLLMILALFLQPGLVFLPGVSAREAGAVSQAPQQDILYVKPLATGAGNCTNWANACELKPALNAAAPGDELWVQKGTYTPDFWEKLTDFTFVAWVYWRGGAAWQRIFDFGKDTQNSIFLSPKDDSPTGRMWFEVRLNNDRLNFSTQNPLGTNVWTHVAVTLSGDTATIYVNGNPVGSRSPITYKPKDVAGDNLWLGRSQSAADPYFNGILDEVALFNRALNPSEITAVVNSSWDTLPGKVLALHLEENPASNGTTLLDSFENTFGGTLITDNGTANKSVTGHPGQALSLDGTADFVALRNKRQGTFQLKNDVAVYGGFAGTEASRDQRDWLVNVTTLSGELGVPENYSDNSYHVVTGSGVGGTAILDGFSITAGNADGGVNWDSGGGMYTISGSPSIANLIFTNNQAGLSGGGMFNFDGSHPQMEDVTFIGNYSGWDGGGLYNWSSSPTITHATFRDNSAENDGGGMINNDHASPTLTDVTFSGNRASFSGGGIADKAACNPVLTRVIFFENEAYLGGGMHEIGGSSPILTGVTFSANSATAGGGMWNESASNPTLTNAIFFGNSAGVDGGAMLNIYGSSPILANITFYANVAGNHGGGMFNAVSSAPRLTNVTFSRNSAGIGGGMSNFANSNPTLTNAILWGNTATTDPQVHNEGSAPIVSYSDIQGGVYPGLQNISADPKFVEGTLVLGNLRLLPSSPAIDAGHNVAVEVATDLDGSPRIVDYPPPGTAVVDMGAYEAQVGAPVLYVDKDAPGPFHNGASWASAFTGLQPALATVGAGQEIWVADGVYYPGVIGNRMATFQLTNHAALYGGFAGNETARSQRDWEANPAILSGDIDRDGTLPGNTYHVVTGTSLQATTVLDGFTITAGNANGLSPHNNGGGMHNWQSTTKLENILFTGNAASNCGGGLTNWADAGSTLTNVAFTANSAGNCGGGMHNQSGSTTVRNGTFSDNEALDGGGGAIAGLDSASVLTIYDSTFRHNYAGISGGAFYPNGSAIVVGSTFVENSAVANGGAIHSNSDTLEIVNSTFVNNSAGSDGGAVDNREGNTTITNSTFSGNSAGRNGDSFNNQTSVFPSNVFTIANSIISSPATNSCFGTMTNGNGNLDWPLGSTCPGIEVNAQLAALADNGGPTETMALPFGSPAIDVLDPLTCPATDQRGLHRPADGDLNGEALCDVGAFEYQPFRQFLPEIIK